MSKSVQITQADRELVWTRDGHCCARCSRSVMDFPSSIHHRLPRRLPRRMGGTRDQRSRDPRNLVRLCGSANTPRSCHEWAESNRALAREQGWLIQSYDDLDRFMVTTDGWRLYLAADGTRDIVRNTNDDRQEAT